MSGGGSPGSLLSRMRPERHCRASATTCASLWRAQTRGRRLRWNILSYRVGLYAGMLAAALGGLDAFVFTAGIGENSPELRARIAAKLAWLGAVLDPSANAADAPLISSPDSRLAVYVIPTDEELMIARHTLALLSSSATASRILEKAQ